jgi:hypothetical protein
VNDGARGIGAILVAVAAWLLARQIGMPEWKAVVVAALVLIGLPLLVTGRWKGW